MVKQSVCPSCGKENPWQNLICRHCGESLHGAKMVQKTEEQQAQRPPTPNTKSQGTEEKANMADQPTCPQCGQLNPTRSQFCNSCGAALEPSKVAQVAMHPQAEVTHYSHGSVQVTNARAIIGSTTYAMANITSVKMAKKRANPWFGIFLAVLGVILFLVAITGDQNTVEIIVTAVMAVAGIAIAATRRSRYIVRIGSASGESDALISKDQETIESIVGAMQQAIIERG